jgi:DNA-binding CsgD family transcriptional regulator
MNKKSVIWIGESSRTIQIVNRRAIHCKTFGDFVEYYSSIPSANQLPATVVLSLADVFENDIISPSEHIDCYTNFIKLIDRRFGSIKPAVGVVVRIGSKLITEQQVEILQATDAIGIMPMQVVYGPDAVAEAHRDKEKHGVVWPSYLISANDHCTPKDTIILTERQQVIFDLIRNRGISNKQIAKYLNLSESAVKFHVGHILKKYNLKNRTQLAALRRSV